MHAHTHILQKTRTTNDENVRRNSSHQDGLFLVHL